MKKTLFVIACFVLTPFVLPFLPVMLPDVWNKAKNGGY